METTCKGCGVAFCPLPVPSRRGDGRADGRRPVHCDPDCKLKRDGARCRRRYATVTVSGRAYRKMAAAAAELGMTVAALVDAAIAPVLDRAC